MIQIVHVVNIVALADSFLSISLSLSLSLLSNYFAWSALTTQTTPQGYYNHTLEGFT
jgi:hypothetical protein